MKRSDVDGKMADYLEGDLPLSDRALFDAHLDADPEAAAEVEALRRTIQLLREMPDPEPPVDLAARVMERIEAGEGRRFWLSGWLGGPGAPRWPAVLVPAAAVAVGVFVVSGDLELVPLPSAPEEAAPAASVADARRSAERAPASPPEPVPEASAETRPPARTPRDESVAPPLRRAQSPTPVVPVAVGSAEDWVPPLRFMGAGGASASDPLPLVVGAASASAGEQPASRAQRADLLLDQRLDLLLESPADFGAWLRGENPGAQEAWLGQLARRALERSIESRVLEALEAAPAGAGLDWASRFAGSIEELRGSVVAQEQTEP